MKFFTGKNKTNHHGTQAPGAEWNQETVRGPKFTFLRLGYKPPYTGWRLIFYFPSGAWWFWDLSTYKEPKPLCARCGQPRSKTCGTDYVPK